MLVCCKNLPVLLWGPLFVGAPVRPNMLNMPKSASDGINFIVALQLPSDERGLNRQLVSDFTL